jgi:hypothetical protein
MHPILVEIKNNIEETRKERDGLKWKLRLLEAQEKSDNFYSRGKYKSQLLDFDETVRAFEEFIKLSEEQDTEIEFAPFEPRIRTINDERYFILDDDLNPKEVSQDEHDKWTKENAVKYYREWVGDSGDRRVSVNFLGMNNSLGHIALFVLSEVTMDRNGNVVYQREVDFGSYEVVMILFEYSVSDAQSQLG